MELTQFDESTTRRVEVKVDDGIVIETAVGQHMKVTRLRLIYEVQDGVWVADHVRVIGQRITQNGAIGRKPVEKMYGDMEDAPKWIGQAAEHYRPKDPAPEAAIPTCVLDVEA